MTQGLRRRAVVAEAAAMGEEPFGRFAAEHCWDIAGMLEVRMDWLLKKDHQPRNIPIMRRFLDVDAANPQDARGCSASASAMSNPNSVRSENVWMFPTLHFGG